MEMIRLAAKKRIFEGLKGLLLAGGFLIVFGVSSTSAEPKVKFLGKITGPDVANTSAVVIDTDGTVYGTYQKESSVENRPFQFSVRGGFRDLSDILGERAAPYGLDHSGRLVVRTQEGESCFIKFFSVLKDLNT